jgi:heavy metal sensor kinase
MLAIAVPFVLGVGIIGGYVLAGRALSPVARITGLAERIGEDDLSSRLNLNVPDDEIGRLAKTFDAMLARIEDAFIRQRRFTGDVAHELRTPLGLMRSQVDLALARPRSAEAYREALQGFDEDLDRLSKMVGTLLTLARADAGQLPLDRAPFDLSETIDVVFDQYVPTAKLAGIVVDRDTTPARVVADEGLVIQVMVNLLDNAITHTPPQGRITIGCRPGGGRARFWVSDTGPGIPPEHRQRVFDRFYRTDAGRTRAQGGVGLGLAIAKAIVDAHGGTISISDLDGSGTRVDVVLPARRQSDAA